MNPNSTTLDSGEIHIDPVTEYGIQFPDGRFQWEGELGIIRLTDVQLHTSKGRGTVRDQYETQLRGVGIDPAGFALRFVTRRRLLNYSAPEPIVEQDARARIEIL